MIEDPPCLVVLARCQPGSPYKKAILARVVDCAMIPIHILIEAILRRSGFISILKAFRYPFVALPPGGWVSDCSSDSDPAQSRDLRAMLFVIDHTVATMGAFGLIRIAVSTMNATKNAAMAMRFDEEMSLT